MSKDKPRGRRPMGKESKERAHIMLQPWLREMVEQDEDFQSLSDGLEKMIEAYYGLANEEEI